MHEHHEINEEAYAEWVEYRHIEKKKKIGPLAEKKQKKMLSAYPPPVQQEIVDQSIMNSYQGLFPPKGQSNGKHQQNSTNPNARGISGAERTRRARAIVRQRELAQQQPDMGRMGEPEGGIPNINS